MLTNQINHVWRCFMASKENKQGYEFIMDKTNKIIKSAQELEGFSPDEEYKKLISVNEEQKKVIASTKRLLTSKTKVAENLSAQVADLKAQLVEAENAYKRAEAEKGRVEAIYKMSAQNAWQSRVKYNQYFIRSQQALAAFDEAFREVTENQKTLIEYIDELKYQIGDQAKTIENVTRQNEETTQKNSTLKKQNRGLKFVSAALIVTTLIGGGLFVKEKIDDKKETEQLDDVFEKMNIKESDVFDSASGVTPDSIYNARLSKTGKEMYANGIDETIGTSYFKSNVDSVMFISSYSLEKIQQLTNSADGYQSEISNLEGKVEILSAKLDEANDTIRKNEKTIEEKDEKIAELEDEVARLKAEIERLEDLLEKLEEAYKKLLDDYVELKEKYDDLKEDYDKLKIEYDKVCKQLVDALKRIKELETENAALKEENERLKGIIIELEDEIILKDERIRELEDKLVVAYEEIADLKEQLKNQKNGPSSDKGGKDDDGLNSPVADKNEDDVSHKNDSGNHSDDYDCGMER